MTVLIVAGERDRTANGVVRDLDARDVDVIRIDTAWFPRQLMLDAEFNNGHWSGELRTCSRRVALEGLRAIWYRSPNAFTLPEGMSAAERQYARREGKLGLGGVLTALPVLAVNDPHSAARAVYKPLQLTVAADCGLTVPTTQITNSDHAVRRFAATAGEGGIVTKALGTTLIYEEDHYKLGYTRRLTASDMADLRGIDVTAHQQQAWVGKMRECRIVVVGDRVFAVAIHAGSAASRIDWRSDYPALSYQVVEPPASVATGVRDIMTRLGLSYGAFDFGIDHDETWWFFEVNPGGVYGWLEYHTGVPVTSALAELLAGADQ
ncbi:MAG: ATP-grasp ribosomal peptide maturase [Pseudonocardiaceae bacterium]